MTNNIETATAILRTGGLVAFPTETVYGLGADAQNHNALARLYAVKGRPKKHPVIVHLGNISLLDTWCVDIPKVAYKLAEAFWPGPLTLILNRTDLVPDSVTGGQETVGIRIPDHPIALELLQTFGGGIAAPSANRFGRISPTSAPHVRMDLGEEVDMILDGGSCRVGVESTIVGFIDDQAIILRPGMITIDNIIKVIGPQTVKPIQPIPKKIAVPGALTSHYAPITPLYQLNKNDLETTLSNLLKQNKKVGILTFPSSSELITHPNLVWKVLPKDPALYASLLYATLRHLDQLNLDALLVETVITDGPWAAIADRLNRASQDT